MVLVVENETSSKDLVFNLVQLGYEIRWLRDMHDAVHIIQSESTNKTFCAVLLDLSMSEIGLPVYARKTAREVYAGWAFYKHILVVYPDLQLKTIFLSDFNDTLEELIEKDEFNKLIRIHKSDPYHEEKILEYFKEWKIKPTRV